MIPKKKSIVLGLYCFITLVLNPEESPAQLFSLDYLYPQRHFHRIEVIAKELWNDLDLFVQQFDSLADHQKEINYLKEECRRLEIAVGTFIHCGQEGQLYLPEDIRYLQALLACLEEKIEKHQQNEKLQVIECFDEMKGYLRRSFDLLQELLIRNIEF